MPSTQEITHTSEARLPRVVSKQKLYAQSSKHALKAIRRAAKLIDHSNPSVALGAIKLILNKCLPDLKSTEHTGSAAINVRISADYIKPKLIEVTEAQILQGKPKKKPKRKKTPKTRDKV